AWFASWSGESHWRWTHVAVPVTGHGQTVRHIRVVEAQEPRSSSSKFSIGIYSDVNGIPGNRIAIGFGNIGQSCGPVSVKIPPTKLKRNTRYWIEEQVQTTQSGLVEVYWVADPDTKRIAYTESDSSGFTYSWSAATIGPYLKLK